MRLLDRYLFRELLTPLAFCLGGFLIFWISFDLFSELGDLQDRKLHLIDIVEYAIAMTPGFLVTILPVVLLLALLYSLTTHARHNEITAMRAAGISIWRICLPHFVTGLIGTVALFVLNESAVPRSADWANRILVRHVVKVNDTRTKNVFNDFGFVNTRRAWFIGEYNLKTGEMLRPQVNWKNPDGSQTRLYAESADYTNGIWVFYDVREFIKTDPTNPTNLFQPLFQTNALAMPDFDETPKQIRSEIKISNYQMLKVEQANIPLTDLWDYLKIHPHLSKQNSAWLLTEFHGRLASPWTCFVVVLIAIPFGTASGRRNLFVGVAGSISICFAFFIIQKVTLAFGSNGALPPWLAAWLPNAIFGITGLILTARSR